MTTTILYILIASGIIMLASLSGAIFTWKTLGEWLRPRLSYSIALATGVFLAIVFSLVQELLHEGISFPIIMSFIFGGLLLEGITHLLPKDSHHHHHDDCKDKGVTFSTIDARRVLVGDAIHNIHDGLALVPAFLICPILGLGTAFGILLHEIVQEIAEFFILKEAGYSTKKALIWNFLVSATILIGVLVALFVASVGNYTIYLIAFSAGGFAYILIRDLMPTIIFHAKKGKAYLSYGVIVAFGALLMLLVSHLVPHEHLHNHSEDDFLLPEGFGLAFETTTQNLHIEHV